MTATSTWVCSLGENEWCTADSPCFTCADLIHAHERAAGLCGDTCPQCKAATLIVGAKVGSETRTRKMAPLGWNEASNAWERGVPVDHTGMPYLDKNLTVMGAKQVAEHRHEIDTTMRHHHAAKTASTTGSN